MFSKRWILITIWLIRNNISVYFYNFNWPDFGVLGLQLLLDVVKVMDFSINEGEPKRFAVLGSSPHLL